MLKQKPPRFNVLLDTGHGYINVYPNSKNNNAKGDNNNGQTRSNFKGK